MVHLNRIYTRTGDDGTTGTAGRERVSKLDLRIVSGGSIDEVNCCIGVAASQCSDADRRELLHTLQQQLFDLGADVSTPWTGETDDEAAIGVSPASVSWIESRIDEVNARQSALKSFVLPGGSVLSAGLHLARSVCRRAELDVLRLQQCTPINPIVAIFLNRLSDLLFVLARDANAHGGDEVLWTPARRIDGPQQ